MILIKEKEHCCGCNACVQICPKQCIEMREDEEGFLYPHVNLETCIDCHLCEKTCPILNEGYERKPLKVYAAMNKNESVRLKSSSGGIFTLLAEHTIRQNGVVFGARFNDSWEVIHDFTETMEGIDAFRGSKYVQSNIGDSFSKAEHFLKSGRKVMFSGAPCQIAALLRFLRKDYDNLLTVDFICHGVPSPGVWRKYLKEEVARQCDMKKFSFGSPISGNDAHVMGISFRDKSLGWKKYSFALTLSTTSGSGEKIQFCARMPLKENAYLRGFLSNVFLRPSCYFCVVKKQKSGSDITLADFWGCDKSLPEMFDDKGTSVLLYNSQKGIQTLRNNTEISMTETSLQAIVTMNPFYMKSTRLPDNRFKFMSSFKQGVLHSINLYAKPSVRELLRTKIIKMLIATKLIHMIKRVCRIKNV